MADQYKENWKRLTGRIPASTPADDSGDLARKSDVDNVGGGTWTEVANGVVANSTNAGTVYTATAGKEYVLIAVCSVAASDNFTSGDEDGMVLLGITGGGVSVDDSILTGAREVNYNIAARHSQVITLGTGEDVSVSTAVGDEPNDNLTVTLTATGAITVVHADNGGTQSTNGLYSIWEK